MHGMGEGRWNLFYLDCAHMEGWTLRVEACRAPAMWCAAAVRAGRAVRAPPSMPARGGTCLPVQPACLSACPPAYPPAHPPVQTACLHACLLADVQGRLSMITKEAARAALALVEADSVDVEDILLGTIHTHQGVHA